MDFSHLTPNILFFLLILLITALVVFFVKKPNNEEKIIHLQTKMMDYSWYDGEVDLLIDSRRFIQIKKGNIKEIGRIEFIEDGFNLFLENGKASFRVSFSDDGRTMYHEGTLSLETPLGLEHIDVNLTYKAHDKSIEFPKAADLSEALKISDLNFIMNYHGGLEEKDEEGQTPLMIACKGSFPDVVEYLVNKGVDINIENNNGGTALSISVVRGDASNVRTLLNAGATSDDRYKRILYRALEFGNNEILLLLIDKDVDYYGRNNDGNTILEAATSYLGSALIKTTENLEAVRILVEEVKIDVNTKNESNGNTAIFTAAETGSINVLKYLIKKGANVNELNKKGYNALLHTVHRHKHGMINGEPKLDSDDIYNSLKFLIDSGIDISVLDENSQSSYELIASSDASRLLKVIPAPKITPAKAHKSTPSSDEDPAQVSVIKLLKSPSESKCEHLDMAILYYDDIEEKETAAKEITIYKGGNSYLLDSDNIENPREGSKKWMSPIKIFKCHSEN